jgi:hypothetical protein
MMRVARLACLIVIAAPVLATPAAAQAPAVDQYTDAGQSGVAGAQESGSSAGNSGSGDSSGTSGGGSQGAQSGASGSAVASVIPSLRVSFGGASDALTANIDAALRQGGITPSVTGQVTKQRVEDFLGSALAKQLSADGAEAVGRAVAELLVEPGAQTAAVLTALLGYAPQVGPATHTVFTRSGTPSGDYADFQKGIVEGSSDVPRAYAEMSDASKSFVEAFSALGVATVDNIDTASGKAALVAILVSGAEGNFGSKPTADAKLVGGEVKPISVTTGEGGGATLTYLLLGLVGVAILWSVLGLRPRRMHRG